MSTPQSTSPESIKLKRSDAKSLDVSKIKDEIDKNKNDTHHSALNNYKSMPLDSNDHSNHDNDTIKIRRSDKINHDVRDLSIKNSLNTTNSQKQNKR
jgi:hypothetical protein